MTNLPTYTNIVNLDNSILGGPGIYWMTSRCCQVKRCYKEHLQVLPHVQTLLECLLFKLRNHIDFHNKESL